jgi:hypothetical protein
MQGSRFRCAPWSADATVAVLGGSGFLGCRLGLGRWLGEKVRRSGISGNRNIVTISRILISPCRIPPRCRQLLPQHRQRFSVIAQQALNIRDRLTQAAQRREEGGLVLWRDAKGIASRTAAYAMWLACATQEEIAEAVESPQQTVADWMKGFTENSTAEESVKWHNFDPPIYNVWKLQNSGLVGRVRSGRGRWLFGRRRLDQGDVVSATSAAHQPLSKSLHRTRLYIMDIRRTRAAAFL